MKTNVLIGTLLLFLLAACAPSVQTNAEPVEMQTHIAFVAQPVAQPLTTEVKLQKQGESCAAPTPAEIARCRKLETEILATTVRLEFHGPNGSIGHGTIRDGRYLVTHDHYAVSAATLANGEAGGVTAVSVFKANGDIILLKAPLAFFTVVTAGPETLVLDFKEYEGRGFFDTVSVPSAEFEAWGSFSYEPGVEVAQIDWDGSKAYVRWVTIDNMTMVDNIPVLRLASFVEPGASGGGVFYEGAHIGNNWFRQTDLGADTGLVIQQFSVATLNSSG